MELKLFVDGKERAVTEQDFAEFGGRVPVQMTLPQGCRSTDRFYILHVFEKDWNGKTIGSYETCTGRVENGKLCFELTGCSPVLIVWVPEMETPVVPQTGDNANIDLWLSLMTICGMVMLMLLRRKNA